MAYACKLCTVCTWFKVASAQPLPHGAGTQALQWHSHRAAVTGSAAAVGTQFRLQLANTTEAHDALSHSFYYSHSRGARCRSPCRARCIVPSCRCVAVCTQSQLSTTAEAHDADRPAGLAASCHRVAVHSVTAINPPHSGVKLGILALDTLPTSALWAADSVVGFCLLVMGTMGPAELHEEPISVQCDEDVAVNALGFLLGAPITEVAAADGRQGAPDHR
jgi:hypothetical protein